MDVTCAILAGGKSRRMGRDKATLKLGDRFLINHVYNTARKVFRRVIILSSRHSHFPGIDVPVLPDVLPPWGPMVGIVSALIHASTPYVFVVACDMPNLSEEAFQYMVGEAHGGEDVIIPHTEYGFEPLHALYNRSCISYFLTAIGKNRLKIPDTFCYLSVRELRYHPSFQHKGHPVFTNINMEKDLSIIPDMNRSENRTIREMNRTDIGEVPSSSSLPGVSSPWGRTVMKKKTNPKIVTAAVIERDGHILIAKRKQGKQHVGNWEFPGGTLEEGETPEQCLKRELQEELAITAEVGGLICISEYSYTPDWTIRLLAYRTTVISGIFNLNDHEEIRWVKPTDLANYDFPEADRPIVEKLIKEDRQ